MGTEKPLLVGALAVASAVLVWIMAAPKTATSPLVPAAMTSLAFLGLCFGLYRAFQRSADTAGRAFDAAMQGVAAELKLEYHPPKTIDPSRLADGVGDVSRMAGEVQHSFRS